MKKIFAVFCLLVVGYYVEAQKEYPKDYFRLPVDFPVVLSGTFGELRSNHFHSGIDIKTGGVEGKNIYAIADGYVSRIKVSPDGYGKAMYITHPNGYTSVYAHLKRYNDSIEHFVRGKQYTKKSFSVDLYLKPGELKVKKGEVIALSGNTGGSMGPHLHFEIRDTRSQRPINPLLFGIKVKDTRKPTLQGLAIYDVITIGKDVFPTDIQEYKLKTVNGIYQPGANDSIDVSTSFSLGIRTIDRLNGANNRNGVYEIMLYVDDSLFYSHDLESFSFSQSRYINSLIDYSSYVNNKRRYQKLFREPGNRLDIYNNVDNNGVIEFNDTLWHALRYEVKDFAGNVSKLEFYARSPKGNYPEKIVGFNDSTKVFFDFRKPNHILTDDYSISIPSKSLYNHLYFYSNVSDSLESEYSNLYTIHSKDVPIHKPYELKVRVQNSDSVDTKKLFLARVDKDGDLSYFGGKFENGFMYLKLRSFGDFVVEIDTISPEIKAINFNSKQVISFNDTIKINISDDLSGVKKYNAWLNDKWILCEYDAKNDLLFYKPDFRCVNGENKLRVEIIDGKGNIAEYETVINIKR